MAKARDISGLHADLSYRDAAARTIAVRAQELFDHAEGVLDTSDIERVHDMRVASRRLRAVLEIYEPCFPRKALRDVLRDVKAVADALGVGSYAVSPLTVGEAAIGAITIVRGRLRPHVTFLELSVLAHITDLAASAIGRLHAGRRYLPLMIRR